MASQVRRAHLDFTSALETVAAAETQLQATDRALQSVQERYDAGSATLVELTQARTTRVEAESRLIQARYNVVAQEKLLANYTDRLDSADPTFQ